LGESRPIAVLYALVVFPSAKKYLLVNEKGGVIQLLDIVSDRQK